MSAEAREATDNGGGDDEVLVACETPSWRVIGASVGGTLVRDGRKTMQDACEADVTCKGDLLLAVADGAGSARLGALGARSAVRMAIASLRCALQGWFSSSYPDLVDEVDEELWRPFAHRILRNTRFAVVHAAAEAGAYRDDVASTLTLVFATSTHVLVAQVGDGRCAALRPDGSWESLTSPQRGAYAGETQFLTSAGWRRNPRQLEVRVLKGPVEAIAVLTDGCERVAYECLGYDEAAGRYVVANTPHAPFLTPNVRAMQRLMSVTAAGAGGSMAIARAWGAFLREGTPELPALRDEPDDKTLVLAVRTASNGGTAPGTSSTEP